MKIAFVLNRLRFDPGDGVIAQVTTWKRLLEQRGHNVVLMTPWDYYDLSQFEIVQHFGYNVTTLEDIIRLRRKAKVLCMAPIIDPRFMSTLPERIVSRIGLKRPILLSPYYCLRKSLPIVDAVLVRSQFEKNRLISAYNCDGTKCKLVPLSNGVQSYPNNNKREDICLHISRIGDKDKNVRRLIEASEKYQFKLILCGKLNSEIDVRNFDNWTKGKHYIDYKGFVSDEEKIDLCQKAKVFALPSIIEGVGLSALEAATWGCDIVITKLGGPQEYYNHLAQVVNPYSIDEIGRGVRYFLDGNTHQPALASHILKNYSDDAIGDLLESTYLSLLGNKE